MVLWYLLSLISETLVCLSDPYIKGSWRDICMQPNIYREKSSEGAVFSSSVEQGYLQLPGCRGYISATKTPPYSFCENGNIDRIFVSQNAYDTIISRNTGAGVVIDPPGRFDRSLAKSEIAGYNPADLMSFEKTADASQPSDLRMLSKLPGKVYAQHGDLAIISGPATGLKAGSGVNMQNPNDPPRFQVVEFTEIGTFRRDVRLVQLAEITFTDRYSNARFFQQKAADMDAQTAVFSRQGDEMNSGQALAIDLDLIKSDGDKSYIFGACK